MKHVISAEARRKLKLNENASGLLTPVYIGNMYIEEHVQIKLINLIALLKSSIKCILQYEQCFNGYKGQCMWFQIVI
jgi:hypothetical protein